MATLNFLWLFNELLFGLLIMQDDQTSHAAGGARDAAGPEHDAGAAARLGAPDLAAAGARRVLRRAALALPAGSRWVRSNERPSPRRRRRFTISSTACSVTISSPATLPRGLVLGEASVARAFNTSRIPASDRAAPAARRRAGRATSRAGAFSSAADAPLRLDARAPGSSCRTASAKASRSAAGRRRIYPEVEHAVASVSGLRALPAQRERACRALWREPGRRPRRF